MPHKRSYYGQLKHDLREADYADAQKEIARERRELWQNAFHDKQLCETANVLPFYWLDIEKGEILKDSRLQGLAQQLEPPEDTLFEIEYNRKTLFYVKQLNGGE